MVPLNPGTHRLDGVAYKTHSLPTSSPLFKRSNPCFHTLADMIIHFIQLAMFS